MKVKMTARNFGKTQRMIELSKRAYDDGKSVEIWTANYRNKLIIEDLLGEKYKGIKVVDLTKPKTKGGASYLRFCMDRILKIEEGQY